ncbi:hypothetical protein [Euhalothece natronophila]|nr:hypothetical protein [Euhalothece natronophila]
MFGFQLGKFLIGRGFNLRDRAGFLVVVDVSCGGNCLIERALRN